MKTPEQQAQEYAQKQCNGIDWQVAYNDFLAGHAAGKQEAEQRIWALLDKWTTGPPNCRRFQATESELKRIIFGEKV